MKNLKTHIFAIILFLFIGYESHSQNWIITESDNSITLIREGWIKSISDDEEGGSTSIYNPEKGVFIMMNEASETFAKGSGDDFCNAIISIREEANKQMPPDQLKMMEDMIADNKAKPAPKVTFSKENGGEILGYQTEKYSIIVNGDLFEEKWITNDQALKSINDTYRKTLELTYKTVKCSLPDESFLKISTEYSNEYMKVELSGIELKNVSYEYGSETLSEVLSIEKEDISPSEFEVPESYSEISFEDFLMAMSDM